MTCVVLWILCRRLNGSFGLDVVWTAPVLPLWFGAEPFWDAMVSREVADIDDAKVCSLAIGLGMLVSSAFSIRTGRWIPAAGAIMALYWFVSLCIFGFGV